MRIKNVNGTSRLCNFWKFFGAIQIISCRARLVTMVETWLYHYDPETAQKSMEWRHSGSPRPKKFRVENPARKFLALISWDQDGIILIDYLTKGQTINAEYYSYLLVQLKDVLKEKRHGKITKAALFLHYNAPAHRALATQKKLAIWASNVLTTQPILRIWSRRTTTCSRDWKKRLKGRHFSSKAEVVVAAETWLDGQPSEFLGNGLRSVLSFVGSMLNKSRVWSL